MSYTKKKIGKILRQNVWDFYLGRDNKTGLCLCCSTTINYDNFHCGHVISEITGGSTDIDNLRPICQNCNLSMGSNNMLDFMKENKLKKPINFDGYILPVNSSVGIKKVKVIKTIEDDDDITTTITEKIITKKNTEQIGNGLDEYIKPKTKSKSQINKSQDEPLQITKLTDIFIKTDTQPKTKHGNKLLKTLPKQELKLICDMNNIKYLSRSTLKDLQKLVKHINYDEYLNMVLQKCDNEILTSIMDHINKFSKNTKLQKDNELINNIINKIINKKISCNISIFGSYDRNTDKIINKVIDDEEDNNETTIIEQTNDNDDNEKSDNDSINEDNENAKIFDKLSKSELQMICDFFNIQYKTRQTISELKELIKNVNYNGYLNSILNMCSKNILMKICESLKIEVNGTKNKIITEILDNILNKEKICNLSEYGHYDRSKYKFIQNDIPDILDV